MPRSTSLLALLPLLAFAADSHAQRAYPPTPPPPIYANDSVKKTGIAEAPPAQFSIGDPTDEEQAHLEYINRSRADASAEALRLLSVNNPDIKSALEFFQVDTNLMKQQFATNPPAPPLSFNAKLITAARGHSQYQFDNAIQTHVGAGGSTLVERVQAVGYPFLALGENVYINAMSVEEGHAAFDIDWGPSPPGVGGMQSPPGHRDSIHNRTFTEIGIGVVKGTKTVGNTTAGPQVVTEDFGRPQGFTPYITGVAYYDINGNNFYDLGEGLPGVRVTVDSISTFAVTTTSGGYSVPVPANRTYTVRFDAPGYAEFTTTVTIAADNQKIDYKPTYTVPTVTSGPGTAFIGIDNVFNIAALPGATGYRARITQLAALATEGAEGSLDRLNITTFGGYPFVSTTVKASGTKSFHLGHMFDGQTVPPQIIEFKDPIFVGANARLDFKSMMAVAGDGEFASLEISTDNGATWTPLWTQFGADIAGEETQFSSKSASLAAYQGQTIRVRFIFDVDGNLYTLPPPNDPSFPHIGWYLDDVTFVNAQGIVATSESAIFTEPRFIFKPTTTGTYQLEFQAINGARTFVYGPARAVTVAANPPLVSFLPSMSATATTVTMMFGVDSGTATSFVLESAPTVTGPWSTETAADIVFTDPGAGRWTVTTPPNGPTHFYRLVVN